jgi:hypothetical protein
MTAQSLQGFFLLMMVRARTVEYNEQESKQRVGFDCEESLTREEGRLKFTAGHGKQGNN